MSDSWHQGEVLPQTGRGFIFELKEAKRAGPDVHRITKKFTLVVVIQEGFYITPQLRLYSYWCPGNDRDQHIPPPHKMTGSARDICHPQSPTRLTLLILVRVGPCPYKYRRKKLKIPASTKAVPKGRPEHFPTQLSTCYFSCPHPHQKKQAVTAQKGIWGQTVQASHPVGQLNPSWGSSKENYKAVDTQTPALFRNSLSGRHRNADDVKQKLLANKTCREAEALPYARPLFLLSSGSDTSLLLQLGIFCDVHNSGIAKPNYITAAPPRVSRGEPWDSPAAISFQYPLPWLKCRQPTWEASCFHPVLSKSLFAPHLSIKASQLLGVLVLSSCKPAHELFKSWNFSRS